MSNRSVEIVAERPLSRIVTEHVAGAVLSLLPQRLRHWWDSVPSDAIVSGTIEAGVASYFFLHVLLMSMDAEIKSMGTRGVAALANSTGDAGVMALGPMIMMALLLKPATLALAVTAADGYVRASSALISHEVVGSVWFAVPEKMFRNANNWLNPPEKTAVRLFKDQGLKEKPPGGGGGFTRRFPAFTSEHRFIKVNPFAIKAKTILDSSYL
jgi:hypothetical protein